MRTSLRVLSDRPALAGFLLCLLALPSFLSTSELLGGVWVAWALSLAMVGYGNVLAHRTSDSDSVPRSRLAQGVGCLGQLFCAWMVLTIFPLPLAIGDLLIARWSANESAASERLRRLLAEQRAYKERNGQFFAVPAEVSQGYRFTFVPGPPRETARGELKSFAVIAVPVTAIKPDRFSLRVTGRRTFCVDSSGRLCHNPGGERLEAKDGRCSEPCLELK